MISILFVCHGNICRSTMAESVFADGIQKRGLGGKVAVSSAATHADELGNPPHIGTRRKLAQEGIASVPHRARLMREEDGERYDLLIGMDDENLRCMRAILKGRNSEKLSLLLDYTDHPRPIADPWYTGDFDATFADIAEGVEGLFRFLDTRGLIG